MSSFRAVSEWRTRALFWLAVVVLVLPVVFRQVAVTLPAIPASRPTP
jgi:hypothetical protein